MNGVFQADAPSRTDAALVASAHQVRALFASIDQLPSWTRTVVLSNLAACGYEEGADVDLDDYLDEVGQQDLSRIKAFSSVVEQIFGPDDGKVLVSVRRRPANPRGEKPTDVMPTFRGVR
jgi:hypothetical protein